MFWFLTNRKKTRRWLIFILLALSLIVVSGCNTLSYYRQAIAGQYQVFSSERSVRKLLEDPKTPQPLRERLELAMDLRGFAESDLKLSVDGHYTKYADLGRPFAVWNVEAAQEFSLEPKSWWYPLVGSLEYRGFFSKIGAEKYASVLQNQGYDVHVGGVEAYSTLGWFKDPLLNTFIFHKDAELAEVIFHELGHQRVFARGDEDFNEAFATTVGQQGAERWLRKRGMEQALQDYRVALKKNDQFVSLIMKTRGELEILYGDQRTEAGKLKSTHREREMPVAELNRQKKAIFEGLQRSYKEMKQSWGGENDYDGWFNHHVNNAKLNSVASYYDLLPGFERLLEMNDGNLEKFYAEAERLSKAPRKVRHQRLRSLGRAQPQ